MRRAFVALVALGVLSTAAGPGLARRIPSLGGDVVIALPDELLPSTLQAHIHEPMVELDTARTERDRRAHPPLPGYERWRSRVIDKIVAAEEHTVWRLRTAGPAPLLLLPLRKCFGLVDGGGGWPADVLRAAGINTVITAERQEVVVRFSSRVGPLPELLAGCLLAGPTGAYSAVTARRLEAREGAELGPPAISRVELRSFGEPGDIVAGSPVATGASALLAPFPDMLLLHIPEELRKRDPLNLAEVDDGLRGFYAELRPDLLVAIYWAGRGGPALGVLPPGLAPARPLPEPTDSGRPLPLTLGALSKSAERIRVVHAAEDPLIGGVVERLAVLLRTRGFGTEPVARPRFATERAPTDESLEVFRWRPPTDDPALALLTLVARFEDLRPVDDKDDPLDDPRLLSPSLEERLEGALALERAWMGERALVPLLMAERWFAIDPDLRGVRVRPDGVPVLDDAYWAGPR